MPNIQNRKTNIRLFCVHPFSIYQKLAELLIQRIGSELHGTGNDDLGRDGVEDLFVPVNYQTGNLSHDLTLQELLTHVNLVENIAACHL